MIKLVGLTWEHSRAIDGLRAVTATFLTDRPGVEVEWVTRPLRAFESASIGATTQTYDMVVLDHPCVGEAAAEGCLVNYLDHADRLDLEDLEADTVGLSFASYNYRGGMWALPIDATTQFSASRPDRLDASEIPADLAGVMRVGKSSGLALALKGIHSLMTFWSICGALGKPIAEENTSPLFERSVAIEAMELLRQLYSLGPREAIGWDPIAVHEVLCEGVGPRYAPYLYGYCPYAHKSDSRPHLRFGDAPGINKNEPCAGTIIGGTGLAISRHCASVDVAVDLAGYLTRRDVQLAMGLAGGQPVRRSSWMDDRLNRKYSDFYRGTIATMDAGAVRPRYAGYITLQEAAGQVAEACVAGTRPVTDSVDTIEAMHLKAAKIA